MSSTCILTDSAAQFPQLGFSGRSQIRVASFSVEYNRQIFTEGQELRASDLPPSVNDSNYPRLIPPTVQQFEELYLSLNQHYTDIIAIITSASMSGIFENAQKAANNVQGRARVTPIDSQTTSVGLGLLVQSAAEAVAEGRPSAEVEKMVRSLIPHTYMMVCTPGMSYLSYAGYIDSSQATVGEMLNLLPIFTLEEGQLSAVEKVRNLRGLLDFMQEFICEFEDLKHIAFIQSTPALAHEAKLMREHAQNCFPTTPFSEHTINLPLATLLGPRTVGLVAVEEVE